MLVLSDIPHCNKGVGIDQWFSHIDKAPEILLKAGVNFAKVRTILIGCLPKGYERTLLLSVNTEEQVRLKIIS